MKVIKHLFRVASLIAMCYTIYLMCFNVVFNAMVFAWIALYFWLVSKDEKSANEIEQELLDKVHTIISLQAFDESEEYHNAIKDANESIMTIQEINRKIAILKY